MSECDFGAGNFHRGLHGAGVIAVSNPVIGRMLQGFDEDLAMVGAAVLEVEQEIQYLYTAQANGVIIKVITLDVRRNTKVCWRWS